MGNLQFDVVYGQATATDLNDTSLVLHLIYGHVSFLFTGDAELAAEQQIIQSGDPSRVASTILKVGHHGSYTSSSPEFLNVVQPQIAVYSAGRSNEYGHPHASTLEALLQVGATVYGTDAYGTIVVETDGESYRILDTVGISLPAQLPAEVLPHEPVNTPPLSQIELPYDPFGRDRNCSAFATHAEAQAFFVAAGGPERDPHRLDGDDDGSACESLP